ncbi:IclR family transcriptional regulator domain-containing protein [Colwellia sp. 12G3]|uniref:IclR family transcriptional regulator domain-containing protein n=1 Tax=Colwellia sp. 12G3 TaxID=2058299 RepID=UPI000C337C19|nr:IclR family transcriptional regulator C-terminal domain-containing protein [Colwellia sp. 12G3]PKI16964.1 IclR family transcriptional regulator [Colwellia sp. 12G3]
MSKQEQGKHDDDQVMIKSSEIVQSLVKGLTVIEAFNQERSIMTLSEVATATGFTRAAARRFLLTLVNEGYAKQEGKLFSLTAKILNLGFAYLSSQDVWQNAKPLMKQLVEQLNESCSAAVLEGEDVVYVERVATTKRIMSVSLNVGTRLPAFATSLGRVLLADMTKAALNDFLTTCKIEQYTPHTLTKKSELTAEILRVNQQGYSLVEQELELGLTSVSVPVRNKAEKVIGALSISTQISQTTTQQVLTMILPALKSCAKRIEQLTH